MTKPKPLPEIQKCPLCGHSAWCFWDGQWRVACGYWRCRVSGPLRNTKRGAINAWNSLTREAKKERAT